MQAGIITIGDELLIGQVVDSNSAFIAQKLAESSIKVLRRWSIGDDASEIKYALNEASKHCDIIIITGGLGPTKDDITKKALAEYFDSELVFSNENHDHLVKKLSRRNIGVKESHLSQCYIPKNAQLLDNKLGTALGLWIQHNQRYYISLPGVPDEMKYIMNYEVISRIQELNNRLTTLHHTFHTCGYGETDLADIIEPALKDLPDYFNIAYLPSIAQVRIRITGMHADSELLNSEMNHFSSIVRNSLGSKIFGEGDTNLSQEIGKLLIEKNLMMCTIESCTGGHLASKFTINPGSSQYFKSGMVVYSVASKIELLGIDPKFIDEHTLYSEELTCEMVIKASQKMNANLVLATNGIAGPDGGTETHPVGTIFIACGNESFQTCTKLKLSKNRERNIEAASNLVMKMALDYLKNSA